MRGIEKDTFLHSAGHIITSTVCSTQQMTTFFPNPSQHLIHLSACPRQSQQSWDVGAFPRPRGASRTFHLAKTLYRRYIGDSQSAGVTRIMVLMVRLIVTAPGQ